MKLDRRRFFTLMAAAALPACVIEEEYVNESPAVDVTQGGSQPVGSQQTVQVSPTQEEPYYPSTQSTTPGCNQWDPSGECIGWTPDATTYGPTEECVDWSPAGECIGWAPAYE